MAKEAKKFGTFGGVFTPSILTILGVIMYLRMGWVVGNSSILGFIGIILMAHIISISTGFSISSISTDKKIEAGGIYYLLSRSLGLPVGGAIGITIFIGTAISIALYVIGFAEVFCLQWGLEQSIDNYRWIGSIVLVIITIVAFISTSLAIKTQYIIMLLIGLSIVSVFLGSNGNLDLSSYAPSEVNFDFAKLFAVFFPAVTGFTAGIAMSGDLRNPKKNIPTGTIAAIVVGLVIYMLLAFFIYFNVDGNALRADNYVLIKYAMFPALVIAGIFGATLSSALGGILGAPRILQALSVDKITPRVFAKGSGASNEPRLAIIVTFVLAEIGILIGQLELIAEIVSMFYLAAYGFINLACFLESWASSDFRPSIKIPLWVPLVGFIFTFGVMLKLNAAAMIASLIINLLLFLWLSKKRLRVNSGDIWFSVWNTVIRTSLKKIENRENHERLWKPNVLMFSANAPYKNELIQFGKIMSGNGGLISHFELHEQADAEVLFPTSIQQHKAEQLEDLGIFSREQICQNIPDAIENIASTYGFAGIEPNTVLLSWATISKEAERFGALTERIQNLNRNLIILDYDMDKGFGKKEHIDIYVGKHSQNLLFTLNLLKSILNHPDWHKAGIRIIHISEDNDAKEQIIDRINKILDAARIQAKIEIINNELEKKAPHEIAAVHSLTSDLIIMGLPERKNNGEGLNTYIENTHELFKKLGSTLIVKSTVQFKKSRIVPLRSRKAKDLQLDQLSSKELQVVWNLTGQKNIDEKGMALTQFINDKFIAPLMEVSLKMHHQYQNTNNKTLLKKELQNLSNELGQKLVGNEESTKLFLEILPHKIKWEEKIDNQVSERISFIDQLSFPSKHHSYFKEVAYYHLNYNFLPQFKQLLNRIGLLNFALDQEKLEETQFKLVQEFQVELINKIQAFIDQIALDSTIKHVQFKLEKEALTKKEPKYYWNYFDLYGHAWSKNIPLLLSVSELNHTFKQVNIEVGSQLDLIQQELLENIQVDSLIAPENVGNFLSDTIKKLEQARKYWSQMLPNKISYFAPETWEHFDEDQVKKVEFENYSLSNNYANSVGQYYEIKLFKSIEGLKEELDRFNKSKIQLDARISSDQDTTEIDLFKEKIQEQSQQLKGHVAAIFNQFIQFNQDLLTWGQLSIGSSLKTQYDTPKNKISKMVDQTGRFVTDKIAHIKQIYHQKQINKYNKENLTHAFKNSGTEEKIEFAKLSEQLQSNLQHLPYFYKKAFTSDDFYSQRDFILRSAIKDKLSDYVGIGIKSQKKLNLLIVTEQGNGLSYFVNQVGRNFDKKQVKIIEANEILFQKTADGIQQWKKQLLQKTEASKVNLIALNQSSYQIMKHLDSFNKIFNEIIELPNPNPKFISELLFKRHEESGLPLYIDNKKISSANNNMFQSLVDKIVEASGGNLKAILYYFLISAKFKVDKIDISLIDIPSIQYQFTKEESVILTHLKINKKINRFMLKRIALFHLDNEAFEKAFNNLLIFQFIHEINGDIYINPLIFKNLRKLQ